MNAKNFRFMVLLHMRFFHVIGGRIVIEKVQ